MRPIDADVLYQKTEKLEKQAREASRQAITEPTQEKWNTILAERSAFKYDITQMPTIDAVPVVRCKDCRYSYTEELKISSKQGLLESRNIRFCNDKMSTIRTVADMHFCSCGERKDG